MGKLHLSLPDNPSVYMMGVGGLFLYLALAVPNVARGWNAVIVGGLLAAIGIVLLMIGHEGLSALPSSMRDDIILKPKIPETAPPIKPKVEKPAVENKPTESPFAKLQGSVKPKIPPPGN